MGFFVGNLRVAKGSIS